MQKKGKRNGEEEKRNITKMKRIYKEYIKVELDRYVIRRIGQREN